MKIENALNSMECVKSAKIVFSTKNLFIDTDDMESVRKKAYELEPGITISETRDEANIPTYHNIRRDLAEIASYIAAFFAALLWIKFYPEKPLIYAGYGLLALVYFASGKNVIVSAFRNMGKGQFFDENFLMTFATIAAFFIGAYTESVAVMLFYRTGEFFQDLAVNKSRRSIKALVEVRPEYANLIKNNETVRVSPYDVSVDDIITVNPGEKIPLDGVIIKGSTSLDQRALTGESVPKTAKAEDSVFAGTVNLTGLIEVRVTKPFTESSVSKILDLVEHAAANKAKTENFITTFAKYYTPAVFAVALCVALVPPLAGFGAFSEWIYRALIVLVVSCPCALLISVPLGYFGGIGLASKKGILVKGANYLEALSGIKAVALDKTGTLTKGVFKVTDIVPYNGFTKEDVMKYALIAESRSNHPIAVSIRNAAAEMHGNFNIDDYEEITGHGVKVTSDNSVIVAGSDKILHKFEVEHDSHVCKTEGSVAHVAKDGVYIGHIIISDELKEDAANAISALKKLGIKNIAVMTGDNHTAASKIVESTGISEYYADLMPEDKADVFKKFAQDAIKDGKGKTMYAGDGINDAPVLALADVGVSMGRLGSDAAIETADVVIMDDSLMKLPESIKIARKTKTIIWQNIIFALGIKALFVILGFFGAATIWEAVFGDVGVALLALLNSMRILKD